MESPSTDDGGEFPSLGSSAMQSLECMSSFVLRTHADVPPPLVGPTTTFVPPHHVYLFGGRSVAERTAMGELYVLDLERRVWTRREVKGLWPRARYFHTSDYWNGKLVVFGGMGAAPLVEGGAGQPCVLDDLWMLDVVTGEWECVPAGGGGGGDGPVPLARYAHLSAVVGDRLVVMGGQEISNEYVFQQMVFHLPERRWESSRQLPPSDIRGSYRSIAVTVDGEHIVPAGGEGTGMDALVGERLTYSRPRGSSTRGEQGEHVLTPHGDVYVFSNSNFTDVHRELHTISLEENDEVRMTDLTTFMGSTATTTTVQPPGLRFPFAAQVGRYLVVGGTYLSQSSQQFALWSLDLGTWQWAKVDAGVLEGNGERVVPRGDGRALSEDALAGGSWNRAVLWPGEGGEKLLVFGNRYRSLQEDYEHRAINLDHIAVIELEVFGIYRAPPRHPALQRPASLAPYDERARVEYALRALRDGRLQDCQVVCEDGRAIGCSARLLEARWDWFKEQRRAAPGVDDTRTLYISEPYPIVKAFLEYIYTLDLVTVLQHRVPVLTGLLMLAKQYGVPHLERLAVHALHGRLDESTALGIYEVATLCECRHLQVRALKMVLAIQKRAGKGPHHRRQQSGALVSAQGATGPATDLPASEGDSARTIHAADHSMPNGSRTGQTYHSGPTKDVGDAEPFATQAFSAPPSAFSPSRRRRRATPTTSRREDAHVQDSPVISAAILLGESEDPVNPGAGSVDVSSDECTVYEPPTYRTRRRSASVATVHHFDTDRDVVDDQGRFLARSRKTAQYRVPPHVVADRRRSLHIARKIASMGSFLHFTNHGRPALGPIDTKAKPRSERPRVPAEAERQLGLSDGERPGYSSDSSSPPSPVTPTDPPLGVEPNTRTSPTRADIPFPFVVHDKSPKSASKMNVFARRHARTKSLGVLGMW